MFRGRTTLGAFSVLQSKLKFGFIRGEALISHQDALLIIHVLIKNMLPPPGSQSLRACFPQGII